MTAQQQFKSAFSKIRAGGKIEDFWGDDIPYSVLRAASESTASIRNISLNTRLANHKTSKLFFG